VFLGSHEHTIDSKGRLTMPSKWRSELSQQVVVTLGLEGCLTIFPSNKFEEIAQDLDKQSSLLEETRNWMRYFLGNADMVDVDGQGRVLITQKLREAAGLNGNVVVLGLVSRIEVWNPEKHRANSEAAKSNIAATAQKIGQVERGVANANR